MAKFNEKVLCLFHKDYKQLKKEAARRGLCYDGNEKTIANIIWKDAYDMGVVDGKALAARMPRGAEPQARAYCLYDISDDRKYRLELTDGQARVISWLTNLGFLDDIELTEWNDAFEDIGRI